MTTEQKLELYRVAHQLVVQADALRHMADKDCDDAPHQRHKCDKKFIKYIKYLNRYDDAPHQRYY